MKTAIVCDNQGYLDYGKNVADNYQLASNETFLIPDSSLLKPRYNGTSWEGMSREEFNKLTTNPSDVSTDPSLKGMVQQLGTTVAKLSVTLNDIEQQLKTNGGNTNGQA